MAALTRHDVQLQLWNRIEEVIGPVPAHNFEATLAWRTNFVDSIVPYFIRGHGLQLIRQKEDTTDGYPRFIVCLMPNPKHNT